MSIVLQAWGAALAIGALIGTLVVIAGRLQKDGKR